MGKLAREFAHPTDALLAALRRAYADEWFAHFNYFSVAHAVTGPSAASIRDLLLRRSQSALVRAERLHGRLRQLGGDVPMKLTDLVEHATDKPFKLPGSPDDVDGLLRAVLDAERTTMRLQHSICELSREHDPLTAALALDLMAEAERGEQELETLLAGEAPDLDGT
jgi:bacterioferritin